MTIGAILLAGGRGTRVDGASKPLFEVGGRTLIAAAVTAARSAAASPITVVGDVLDESLDVQWIREDPPFGGPAAAIVAALEQWQRTGLQPEWTFVLACDLPAVSGAVARLTADLALLPADADGVCLGDASSRPQWLTGVYRTRALADAASALPDRGANAPVRLLLDDLAITVVRAEHLTGDIDTWEDLAEARALADAQHPVAPERGDTMSEQSRTLPPEALDAWAAALCERFGLDLEQVPVAEVLDMTRVAANGVARPAAPLGAFVAGLAAGRAGGTPEDVRDALGAVAALAEKWDG